MNRAPVAANSEIEWLLLTTPDDTEEAPWMTTPEFQWRVCTFLLSILERYKRAHDLRWYLIAELKVTMPRGIISRDLDLGPDLLMAESDDHERTSWNVAIEGGPPLFVLEVVTEESRRRDTEEKPLLYERMGVQEYAIFDPKRSRPGSKLFGYRRDEDGQWVAWANEAPNTLRSKALGELRLFVDGDRVRVLDHEGNVLLSDEEAANQEAARADEEAARADEEAARAKEQAARAEEAEAELRRLKARYGIAEE
ncbi:MAG TPA: Uma2 family endonuclease [Chloroflexota bacterium]|jgi:Uma2 family endonuclease